MKVAELFVEINTKLDNFKRGMGDVDKSMAALGDKMANAGKKLSLYVTAPIMAVGAASIKMAMDAVESENLFEVSMGKMAKAARDWSVELSKTLGLNQYEVRKTVGTFNVMLKSMGMSEEAAFNMAKGLSQLAYDMASFYNLKPEEAFLKLQSGISGEIEPLKRLGILVNENTIKHWALTHGLIKQGETLTEQQKVFARYNVIMEQTSLAQGDLARTIESPTNQLRIMKSRMAELSIEIGMRLLPTFEKILKEVSSAVKWFSGLSDGTQDLLIKIAGMVAALGPALIIFGNLIKAVATLKTLNLALATSLAKVGAIGVAAFIGWNVGKLIGDIKIAGKTIDQHIQAKLERLIDTLEIYKSKAELGAGHTEALRKRQELLAEASEKAGRQITNLHDALDILNDRETTAEKQARRTAEVIGEEKTQAQAVTDAMEAFNEVLTETPAKQKEVEKAFIDMLPKVEETTENVNLLALAWKTLHDIAKDSDPFDQAMEQIESFTGKTEDAGQKLVETSQKIRTWWDEMADGLKTKWATTISDVLSGATSLKDGLAGIWDAIKEQFFDMIGQMVAKWITDFIGKIIEGAANAGEKIAENIGNAIGGAGSDSIAGAFSKVSGAAGSLASGLTAISSVISAIASVANLFKKSGPSSTDSWHFEHIWINTKEIRDYLFIEQWKMLAFAADQRADMNASLWNANEKLSMSKNFLKELVKGQEKMTEAVRGVIRAIKDISHFQSGGIVMRPTLAMVGEGGPEAIVPLHGNGMTGAGNTYIYAPEIRAIDSQDVHRFMQGPGKDAFFSMVKGNVGGITRIIKRETEKY